MYLSNLLCSHSRDSCGKEKSRKTRGVMTVKNLEKVATVYAQCCSLYHNVRSTYVDSSVIPLPPGGLELCEGASKMEEAGQSHWTNCKLWERSTLCKFCVISQHNPLQNSLRRASLNS